MDIFTNLFSAAKFPTDIYISLFSASVTLAGFIAVFLVFRYTTIDSYVDDAKATLRSLLKVQIDEDPCIAIIIQEIGKKSKLKNSNYIWKLISQKSTEKNKVEKKKDAVKKFVDLILAWRKLRNCIVCFGLASIFVWALLSLIYLKIFAISNCFFNNSICTVLITTISIKSFVFSMLLTLAFVSYSLLAKRPG